MPLKYNAKADTEGESFEDIEPAVNGQGLNAMRTSYTHRNEYHGSNLSPLLLSTHPFKCLCVSVGNSSIFQTAHHADKSSVSCGYEGKVLLDSQGNLAERKA